MPTYNNLDGDTHPTIHIDSSTAFDPSETGGGVGK